MINAIQATLRRFIVTGFACVVLALSTAPSAHAGSLKYFGMNLAWAPYGSTFTSGYNSGQMGTWLNELQQDHLNFIRVFVCEAEEGLYFDSNWNCTGISSQLISNVKNFLSQANSKGFDVELVFINYMDVQNHPDFIGANQWSLINNALVPLGKAVQPYSCQIDLVNEGNQAWGSWSQATGTVNWTTLRTFCQNATGALHQNGVNRWVTMSGQNATDFTQNFSTTFQGVGLDFYEFHDYNGDGSVPVASSMVDRPIELNEIGNGGGWLQNAYSTNKTVLGNFVNNAQNEGYLGVAVWCYINDSNYALRGNQLMGDISWWGSYLGT